MKTMITRSKIAKSIILHHSALITFVILLYVFDAILPDELASLLAILAPITSLYVGTFFRNLANELRRSSKIENEEHTQSANKYYARIVLNLIRAHFIALFLLISAKAIFNFMEFNVLVLFLGLLESAFGSYIGSVLGVFFNENHT